LPTTATIICFSTTVPGPETEKLAQVASEAGVWLVVSIVEKNANPDLMPYNAMLVIDPSGRVALKYRKMKPVESERTLVPWRRDAGM